MTKKLLLLDLDRTLLDTQRFMHDLWMELSRVYATDYDYQMARVPHWYRSMGDYRYYDLKLHIEEDLHVAADEAIGHIMPAMLKNDYLFDDAKALSDWQKMGYDIRIMTFGPLWVQEFKLRCMPTLKDIPKDIILEDKGAFIARQYADREGFLVDDKRNVTLPKNIREVWLDREATNRNPEGIITINSLTELREVL